MRWRIGIDRVACAEHPLGAGDGLAELGERVAHRVEATLRRSPASTSGSADPRDQRQAVLHGVGRGDVVGVGWIGEHTHREEHVAGVEVIDAERVLAGVWMTRLM